MNQVVTGTSLRGKKGECSFISSSDFAFLFVFLQNVCTVLFVIFMTLPGWLFLR